MKHIYNKKIWFYFLSLAFFGLHAQTKTTQNQQQNPIQELQLNDVNQRFYDAHGVVRCATVEAHELRMQNDPSVQSMDAFENWLAPLVEAKKVQMLQDINNGSTARQVYNIPIIFHVITGSVGDANDIDSAAIYAQIDQLNLDFNNQAGSSYPVAHSADINFVPAQVDPNGNPLAEPGIDRVYGYPNAQSQGSMDGGVKQATIWDRNQYANIWVANLSGGLLGYAQFPSNSTLPGMPANGGSAQTDGVVIGTVTVGSVAMPNPAGAPYNKGRTLTHELGHWIGLRHIWGDSSSCSNDDFCADTPDATDANYGCPTLDSCPSDGLGNDMVENYMDYTDDSCMDTFTFDQVARIITVIENADGFDNLVNSTTGNSSPTIVFQTTTLTEYEGTGCGFKDINVSVNIGAAPSADATVTFSASGTATNMVDYEIMTPNVTFSAGATASQTLTIRVYEDSFVEADETVVINMTLSTTGDAELSANNTVILTIQDDDSTPLEGGTVTLFSDDFESYDDFDIGNIGGWTMNDGDGAPHYGDADIDFPNAYYTGTFIVFNPSQTTPAASANWAPHSGSKGYYCFAATTPPNNDHIFTEQISLNGTDSELRLWMRSLTDQWGADRFNVKISTTNTNVSSFTTIQPLSGSATPHHDAPTEWTEYVYDLSAYDGQNIYVAIHCVSNDSYVLMLDDISVTTFGQDEVQTTVNAATSASMNLKGAGTAYAFDSSTGNVMAKVQNNDSFDYGCTNVSVLRDGTAAQVYESATSSNYVADKAFSVTSANSNVTGDTTLAFYFTEAEIAGWEAATGRNRSEIVIIREVDGNAVESVAATVGSYGSDVTFEASFSGANGDYYFGPPEALSIKENTFENFALYPNPSKGEVTVQLNSNEDVKVTLYDIRGREVYTNNFSNDQATFNKTINLETVSTGLYLIQFESGNKKTTKKLIIK
ncbi:putative secreted protein (Por secretion system target) [Oceanihabitans sediminis]|uniref:T9SS C-terminal target domain-containing protein n=1 Tax=Oceanihabitans sediminis TaxID=1812012 RepID=A0A368P853_9FLAO|nr:T9SS type A sorting domain-containing protein [Oceanihabitans sediminis]RBP32108.1 putative secreted protein (Por secretion system target) [Oceanihabitans sediminis]RCU58758.1 T9SS C-terminal target domain-containing protein [Oceanihabitans sediminis]